MINKESKRRLFINRPPTLWRHNIPFVDVIPIEDDNDETIHVSPLFLEPLNADYDGDALSLVAIHDTQSIEEATKNAYLGNNVFYDHEDQFLSVVRHEALYTAYLLTKDYKNINTDNIIVIQKLSELEETPELYEKPETCVEFKNNYYSYGICLFNKWCGFDDIVIYTVINKKNNNYISECIYEYYKKDSKIFYKHLNNLEKNLFFFGSVSNYYPPTINVSEMLNVVDDTTRKIFNKVPDDIEIGYLINQSLIDRCLHNFKKTPNTLYYLFKSGSRFSDKQLSRTCLNIGFCADANNKIQPSAINTNLLIGLNEKEFFQGGSGTRKGINDKKRSTPDSGYLERSIAMGMSIIEIAEDDCKTNSYLVTKIINSKHNKTLIGKWYKTNENDVEWALFDNETKLNDGQYIYLRSPIYCETPDKKICKKCWGEKVLNTKYLGILAGQILAERFTQLTMRTFHESGSAQLTLDKTLHMFVRNHLIDIEKDSKHVILVFNTYDIPSVIFQEVYSSIYIMTKANRVHFRINTSEVLNNDPIAALKNVKSILKTSVKNIKMPNEYYDMLMEQILTVGAPYSSFVELLLTNMFITDIKNNQLWRYNKNEKIVQKLGDKTLAGKTSPLLDLLYQQNRKTVENIEFLDKYIDSDKLTIYEKLFLEKFN